jgi:anti-sigma regulatory factor (Ser/Thr protein kinase)
MPRRIGVGMNLAFVHREAACTPPDLGHSTAELVLASDGDAPRAARHAVRDLCRGRDGDCIADAEIVVSELVTNAVVHAGGDGVALSFWRRGTTIDVRIFDGGLGFMPQARAFTNAQHGGRGLGLVDALVESWGSSEGGPSSVWFRSAMPSMAA